jgi:hypothetical protein
MNDSARVLTFPVQVQGALPLRRLWTLDIAPRPAPEPLRRPEFGKPDAALARVVCDSIYRAMPAEVTPWKFSRALTIRGRRWSVIGWAVVSALCALAMYAGR